MMARRLNSKSPRAPRACRPRTYSPSNFTSQNYRTGVPVHRGARSAFPPSFRKAGPFLANLTSHRPIFRAARSLFLSDQACDPRMPCWGLRSGLASQNGTVPLAPHNYSAPIALSSLSHDYRDSFWNEARFTRGLREFKKRHGDAEPQRVGSPRTP